MPCWPILTSVAKISRFCGFLSPVIMACALVFWPFAANSASGLMLSKSLPHYSDEMEFYYSRPRPEMLPDLLKNLNSAGILAHNEKRLLTAAFFAALSLENRLDLEKFAQTAKKLGPDAARTMAWSAHLAAHKAEKRLLASLLAGENSILERQIINSPAPLNKWDILAEPSILQMYWGAFMATGKNVWLDQIIGAALVYGRLEVQGLWRQRGYEVGRAAAASLYEFAPRHLVVARRLEYFLTKSKGVDEKTLRRILRK